MRVLDPVSPTKLYSTRGDPRRELGVPCTQLHRTKLINIEALSAAPPEALAHSRSQMPLSCPVAPPSQRELHEDGGGGGSGVAGRARAARAPTAKVLRHVLWHVLRKVLRRGLHVFVLHVT